MPAPRADGRSTAWLALAGALALAPWAALAEGDDGRGPVEIGDLDLDALLDPELAAASLHEERSSAAPASVFVLGRDDLRTHGFETLAEALRSVPGLFTYSDGFYQYVGVRGTGLLADYTTRLLVLVDGHPLNNGLGFAENNLGRDFPVPLAAVERIEVVKGPVGGVYGPTAFLGVVNVVTRGAGEPGWQVSSSLDVAQGGVVAERLVAVGAGQLGAVSVRGGVETLQAPGYTWTFPELAAATDRTAPPGGRIAGMDVGDAFKAYLRADTGPVSLLGGCGHWHRGLPSAPYSVNLLDARNHEDSLDCFGQLGIDLRLGATTSLSGRLGYDHFAYRDLLMYDPPLPGGGGGIGPFRDVGTDDWLSADLRLSWSPAPGWRATAGATGETHRTTQLGQSDLIPPLTVDPVGGLGVGTIAKDYATAALYALADWEVTPGLTLNGGLNWYRHQLFGSQLTPRAAVIWRPDPRDTLKLVYAEGFRPPALTEAFFDDVTEFIPNPDIKPERARSYEAVYERRLPGGLSLALSVFRNEYRDLIAIATVPAPGVANPDPANPADFRQQGRNLGAYRVTGAELSGAARLGGWLSAFGGLSLQRSSEDRPNFPAVTANLALSAATPWRPLRLTARGAFASARDKDPDTLAPGQAPRVPALVRLDLGAHLEVPGVQGLTAEIAALNLLQEQVLHPVSGDFAPITQMSEAPRTFRLGIRYTR